MSLSEKEYINQLEQRVAELEKECFHYRNANNQCVIEKMYESLFEMSDDAILVIDNNTFVDCNSSVVKMLGYKNKEELLNTHPSELSPEIQPDGRLSYEKAQEMMEIALKQGNHHFEWVHTRANGEDFPVEVWLSKVPFNGKTIINTIWRDLTEKKTTDEIIVHNHKEKEVLIKEIHHRVKNNLQIVTSLLNLQSSIIEDEAAKSTLDQCKFRIESMARVHEMLYDSDDLSNINYNEYLHSLLNHLVVGVKEEFDVIQLEIDVDTDLVLNINSAVPIGLIINELATNSLKHAFHNKVKGTISISLKMLSPHQLALTYKDNGVGFSEDIDENNTSGLGLQIITGLVDQLSGTIVREKHNKGVRYQCKVTI